MTKPEKNIFEQIKSCVAEGEVRCSSHGYDELAADRLYFDEIISGLSNAEVIEMYPEYPKGPSILLLQHTPDGFPVPAVWGIPKGYDCPAVLVTAYRPDREQWDKTFTRRE
jgi:hypothetical protein